MTQPVQEPTQGRVDAAQGFVSRQLLRRPAPVGSSLEWFWTRKTSDQNRNTGAYGVVAPWDTYDSSGSAFDMSDATTGGQIYILKTGIYAFSGELTWSTTAAPCYMAIEVLLNPNGSIVPEINGFPTSIFAMLGPTGLGGGITPDQMDASGNAYIITLDPAAMTNNLVRMTSAQASGSTKTMTAASMFGVRIGDA